MRRMDLTLMAESGGGGTRVLVTNQNIESNGTGNAAGYRLNSSGAAQKDAGAGSYSSISGEWMLTGAAADYECRFHEISGTVSTGTVDTWQALSSTRTWTVTASIGTEKTCTGTVSIRDAVTLDVLDTATITLTCENL